VAEKDTWEPRENLGNVEDLVQGFKKEYSDIERLRKKKNVKEDRKKELLGRYMMKILYR